MKRSILVAVVAACIVALALPSMALGVSIPAPPYTTAEACLACHAVQNSGPVVHTVDFSAPAVDLTNCNKCHWIAAHPPHGVGTACAGCHTGWPFSGNALPYVSSVSLGAYGNFSSSNSASLDGPTLHAIHSQREWPADVKDLSLQCASCHAPAACDACHGPIAHDGHPTQNGNPAPDAPLTEVSPGTPPGVNAKTAFTTNVSCAAAACHGGISAERVIEDSNPAVTTAGSWTAVTNATSGLAWSGGTALFTNTPGSTVSIPFTGSQVSVWGYTGYNAGAIAVYVDGALIQTHDLGTTGLHSQNGVWFSANLAPGAHVLMLAAQTGQDGTVIFFDRLVARDVVPPANLTPTCASCHPDRAVEHGYNTVNHVANETDTIAPNLGGKKCSDCHAMDLSTAHEAVGGCEVCHSPVSQGSTLTAEGTVNPDHVPGRWDHTCEQCHNTSNPVLASGVHLNIGMHDVSGVANDATCMGCHGSTTATDLPTVHASAQATVTIDGTPTVLTGCDVCHKNPSLPRDANGWLSNDCTVCHFTMDNHPNANHTSTFDLTACDAAGCHTSSVSVTPTGTTEQLVPIHTEHNAAFACADCHTSTNAAVEAAILAGNTNCDACHAAISGAAPHRDLHPANPALVDGSGPHYAYVTGSAPGGSYTSDCAGCHTSNLVDEHVGLSIGGSVVIAGRHDSAGNALTCATCHSSLRGDVIAAIGAGRTNCDACHVVHAQIPALHTSSYKVNPEVPCGDCHSADLTVVHNNGLTATTPAGTTLTGCALCHSYTTNLDSTTSTMGARVQAAISGGVSLCTACHLSYHANVGASHVASTPPSVSGCGGCHTGATTAGGIDVTVMHQDVTTPGPCSVCHNNKPRVPDITLKTAECASCHTIDIATGAGHANLTAKHTYSAMSTSCIAPGCHVNTLPEVHSSYVGSGSANPQFATTCDLCHHNPTRIPDITTKTAACTDCHPTIHGDIGTIHTATDTVSVTNCTTCHGSGRDRHTREPSRGRVRRLPQQPDQGQPHRRQDQPRMHAERMSRHEAAARSEPLPVGQPRRQPERDGRSLDRLGVRHVPLHGPEVRALQADVDDAGRVADHVREVPHLRQVPVAAGLQSRHRQDLERDVRAVPHHQAHGDEHEFGA